MGSLPAGSYIIQNSSIFILGITPTKQITPTGMNYAALDSQLFYLEPQPLRNAYIITHISTGSVVELAGGNPTPGTPVVLANRTGGDNQLWDIQPVIGYRCVLSLYLNESTSPQPNRLQRVSDHPEHSFEHHFTDDIPCDLCEHVYPRSIPNVEALGCAK